MINPIRSPCTKAINESVPVIFCESTLLSRNLTPVKSLVNRTPTLLCDRTSLVQRRVIPNIDYNSD